MNLICEDLNSAIFSFDKSEPKVISSKDGPKRELSYSAADWRILEEYLNKNKISDLNIKINVLFSSDDMNLLLESIGSRDNLKNLNIQTSFYICKWSKQDISRFMIKNKNCNLNIKRPIALDHGIEYTISVYLNDGRRIYNIGTS